MSTLKKPICEIPPDGNVNANDLTTKHGFCYFGCNSKQTHLKRHFLTTHKGGTTEKIEGKPRHEIIYEIPENGHVDVNRLYAKKGFCHFGCNSKQENLKTHYQVVHLKNGIVVPGKETHPIIYKIPKNGNINPDHLYTRGGFCEFGCNSHQTHLRRHFLSVHKDRKPGVPKQPAKRPKKATIYSIPESGKVNPMQLCESEGYCHFKCNAMQPRLQRHFFEVHVQQGGKGSQTLIKDNDNLKRKAQNADDWIKESTSIKRNKNIIYEIPENGDVDPKRLTTEKGYCFYGCNDEYSHLQRHYFAIHPDGQKGKPREEGIKVIPANGQVDFHRLTTRGGYCFFGCDAVQTRLKRHYEEVHPTGKPGKKKHTIIKEIPPDGDVNPKHLNSGQGYCHFGCDAKFSHLKRHYYTVHPNGQKGCPHYEIVRTIPANGEVNPEHLTSYFGYCSFGCEAKFYNLKRHYYSVHLNGQKGSPRYEAVKTIPSEGPVDVQKLAYEKGWCRRGNCNKSVSHLRRHYENVHLHLQKACNVCGKKISKHNYAAHEETHSGPARCSVCPFTGDSIQSAKLHVRKTHHGVIGARPILCNQEEAAAFREEESLKLKTTFKPRNPRILTNIKKRLHRYELRLHDPKEMVNNKATKLQVQFERYFDIPDDASIAPNASFFSIWNIDWKIPELVYEVVEERKGLTYSCSTFAGDPKAAPVFTQPKSKTLAKSGYHRGHMASSANFFQKVMAVNTYYYSNVCPMTPMLNTRIRLPMERFIREQAKEFGRVEVIHFPIMPDSYEDVEWINNMVAVPPSIGTVLMTKKGKHRTIKAWELHQSDIWYSFRRCMRDPFDLMERAGLDFKMARDKFQLISKDTDLTVRKRV